MDTRHNLNIGDIVDWLLEKAPSADKAMVEQEVDATVKAIVRQQAPERVTPGTVNKRLIRIHRAIEKLALLLNDDDPIAQTARKVLAAEVGKAEFQSFQKRLEDLALGQCLKDTEFAPALESDADEYASRVGEAARGLSALLSEHSPFARALYREIRSTAIEYLRERLQDLATAAESARVPTGQKRSALFAPAEVAKYGTKLTSGGRPVESDKLPAACFRRRTLTM